MLVMTFLRSIYWGLALLFSLAISTMVWLFFTSQAKKNKLSVINIKFGSALTCERPDFFTVLLFLPIILLGPIFYFFVGFLALYELWEI